MEFPPSEGLPTFATVLVGIMFLEYGRRGDNRELASCLALCPPSLPPTSSPDPLTTLTDPRNCGDHLTSQLPRVRLSKVKPFLLKATKHRRAWSHREASI